MSRMEYETFFSINSYLSTFGSLSLWFFFPACVRFLFFRNSLLCMMGYMCERACRVPLAENRPRAYKRSLTQFYISMARIQCGQKWTDQEVVSRQIHPRVLLRRLRHSTSEKTGSSFSPYFFVVVAVTSSFGRRTKEINKNKPRKMSSSSSGERSRIDNDPACLWTGRAGLYQGDKVRWSDRKEPAASLFNVVHLARKHICTSPTVMRLSAFIATVVVVPAADDRNIGQDWIWPRLLFPFFFFI